MRSAERTMKPGSPDTTGCLMGTSKSLEWEACDDAEARFLEVPHDRPGQSAPHTLNPSRTSEPVGQVRSMKVRSP
jgi:hypothetical protein